MSWYAVITVYATVKPNYSVDISSLRKVLPKHSVDILPGSNNKLVKVWTLVENGLPSHLEAIFKTIRETIGDINLVEIDGDMRGEDGFSEMNMKEAGVKQRSILWVFDTPTPDTSPTPEREAIEGKEPREDNTLGSTSPTKLKPIFAPMYGMKIPLYYITGKDSRTSTGSTTTTEQKTPT